MNKREIYKLFKPYIVRRASGYCAVLIPLRELDVLANRICIIRRAAKKVKNIEPP